MVGVLVASLFGGILKAVRFGKLSARRWISELIGAVIIGNLVFNVLKAYTQLDIDLILAVVACCAVIWTHVLDMFKDYLTNKFNANEGDSKRD